MSDNLINVRQFNKSFKILLMSDNLIKVRQFNKC